MVSVPTIISPQGGRERSVDTPNYIFENCRIIWVCGEITDELAQHVFSAMMVLDQISSDDITLLINSPGGSVSAGMCIIDAMHLARSRVVTIVCGIAASMAALILAAGEKGMRSAMPNSEIMIHQPLTGVQGAASDIDIAARRVLGMKQKIANFLADVTGQQVRNILKYMDRDTWFSAAEACEFGLCDMVCSELPY